MQKRENSDGLRKSFYVETVSIVLIAIRSWRKKHIDFMERARFRSDRDDRSDDLPYPIATVERRILLRLKTLKYPALTVQDFFNKILE